METVFKCWFTFVLRLYLWLNVCISTQEYKKDETSLQDRVVRVQAVQTVALFATNATGLHLLDLRFLRKL